MIDFKIDLLNLSLEDAAGHEHRVRPIAARAAALFAARLDERWADKEPGAGSQTIDALNAPLVSLNLSEMSDEQAADRIANAWLEVVALKLKL